MTEQQLKEFGARAETLVEIPDFAALDRRGHDLRIRRRAGVAAALAAVLALSGAAVWQTQRSSVDDKPIERPHSQTHTYQGASMKTLAAGTYQLHPSADEGKLVAELTLPRGWNAWVGPNKFDGHAPGRSNGAALGHMTWYVGALALEVDQVNTHGCRGPGLRVLESRRQVVDALSRAFSMELVREPRQVQRFGHQATRMQMRVTREFEDCPVPDDAVVFHSTLDGSIQYAPVGTVLDIWVVDVDGRPIYVQGAWTPNAPARARTELDGILDSIRFKNLD